MILVSYPADGESIDKVHMTALTFKNESVCQVAVFIVEITNKFTVNDLDY